MRCLILAQALHHRGVETALVCRDIPATLADAARSDGIEVITLPTAARASWQNDADLTAAAIGDRGGVADLLVADAYPIATEWEIRLRPVARIICVIDDLANRRHDADILIDQNYLPDFRTRYDALLPAHAIKLLGPSYVLLRPQFAAERARLRVRDGSVKKILICFGGSDPTNETEKALIVMRPLAERGIALVVVVGGVHPQSDHIADLCQKIPRASFLQDTQAMAPLMAEADLAIGFAGSMTWERCCLGLPAVVAILTDHQAPIASAVAEAGAAVNLGLAANLEGPEYLRAVNGLTPDKLRDLQERNRALVDGQGVERVTSRLMQLITTGGLATGDRA
jgi:UDP-2,4-diacetamido-2,4,6-trideoxy-beta-L-altropyranose hydrolase